VLSLLLEDIKKDWSNDTFGWRATFVKRTRRGRLDVG
jgi:hypothetical protein